MSGSYQNLYMLYNSLQGQINNIVVEPQTLEEILTSSGNGGNNSILLTTAGVITPPFTNTSSPQGIDLVKPFSGDNLTSSFKADSLRINALPVNGKTDNYAEMTNSTFMIRTKQEGEAKTEITQASVSTQITNANDILLSSSVLNNSNLTLTTYDVDTDITKYMTIESSRIAISVDGIESYGTAGQVLTSGGENGNLTWADGGGGGSQDIAQVLTEGSTANVGQSITLSKDAFDYVGDGTNVMSGSGMVMDFQGVDIASNLRFVNEVLPHYTHIKTFDSSVFPPVDNQPEYETFVESGYITLTQTKNVEDVAITDYLALEPTRIEISVAGTQSYGIEGQVLTSGGEDGNLSWTTQDLDAVLTSGNSSTQNIVLRVNPTDEDGNKAVFSASSGSYITYDNFVVVNQTLADSGKVQITTGNPDTTGSENVIQSNLINIRNATQYSQMNPNTITMLNGDPAGNRNFISISTTDGMITTESIQTGVDKRSRLSLDNLTIANNIADEVGTLSTTYVSFINGDLNASFSEVSMDSSTTTLLAKQQGVGVVRQTEINTTTVQVYESLALGQDNYVSLEAKQIGIGVDGVVDYGEAGQVLTSGGVGGVLSWTTPSGTPSLDAVLAVAPAGEVTEDKSITFKETDSPFLTTTFDIDGINSTRPSLELQNDTLINIGTDNNGPNTITIGHNVLPTSDFSPVNINGKFSINGVLFSGADGGSPQIGVSSFTIPQDALRNSLYTLIISGTANPTPINFPTDDTGGKYITIFNGGNQSLRCQCSAVPTRLFVGGNNGLAGGTTYAIRANQTVQFLSAGAQGFLLFAQSNPNSNVGTYPFPIQSLTANQRVIATTITGAAVNGTFTYTSIAGQQNFTSPASVQLTAQDATGNHIMTLRTNTVSGFTYVSSTGSLPTTLHIYALGV